VFSSLDEREGKRMLAPLPSSVTVPCLVA